MQGFFFFHFEGVRIVETWPKTRDVCAVAAAVDGESIRIVGSSCVRNRKLCSGSGGRSGSTSSSWSSMYDGLSLYRFN